MSETTSLEKQSSFCGKSDLEIFEMNIHKFNSLQSNQAEIEFQTEIKEKFYAKHINSNA